MKLKSSSTRNSYLFYVVCFSTEYTQEENLAKSLENMVAKFYSGDYCLEKEQRGFYLIMEDLSSQYCMKTGPEGLNFQQISNVLVKIAKFHSAGYAYNINRIRKYSTVQELLQE